MLIFSFITYSLAYETTPQTVVVSDEVTVFDAVQIDSGWLPSTGTLGVRLQVSANGTADVDMEGQGNLTWPSIPPLTFTAEPEAGHIRLDAELNTSVDIRVNVFGISQEFDISSQTIAFAGEKIFQPFSMGVEQVVETTESGNDLIDFSQSLLGNEIRFSGELRPTCTMRFSGINWDVGEEQLSDDSEIGFTPQIGDDVYARDLMYNADIVTHCEFEFVPVFEVCPFIGDCIDWDIAEMEIDSLDSSLEHQFVLAPLSFPLPSMSAAETVDFGVVEINQLSNAELALSNVGALLLQGSATLADETLGFSMFGANFYIPPEGQDSVVFAFASPTIGTHTTTVTIQSNDPAQPEKSVNLVATVVEEGEGERKKGCSAVPGIPLPMLLFWGMIGLVRRQKIDTEM